MDLMLPEARTILKRHSSNVSAVHHICYECKRRPFCYTGKRYIGLRRTLAIGYISANDDPRSHNS